MVTVQPGQVPTYDPSVTLTNYSDSNRTRFLYNGNQFVKARLVSSRASYAYVGSISSSLYSTWTTSYTNYKNMSGDYVLVDGEMYTPQATGAPPAGNAHYVIIHFPIQVATSEIILWSLSHLDFYGSFSVSYSYDGSYYFDISGVSTQESYDDTVQRVEGESPPTGEYKYTISLGSTYTARYFRISVYQHTTTTAEIDMASDTTIQVSSTTGFPSSWLTSTNSPLCVGIYGFTYTAKTSTTFTGVTFSAAAGAIALSSHVWSRFSFAEYLTEVDVVGVEEPILEIWDSDGSQASSQDMDYDYYYDIVYDRDKDVYFSIRYNTELDGTGGAGFSLSDSFDEFGSSFNSVRWTESTINPNFQHNTVSGTADYLNSSAPGQLTTNYYLEGDFDVTVGLGFNYLTASGSRIELRGVDVNKDNVFTQVGVRGPFVSAYPAEAQGNWEAVQIRKTVDTTGGLAEIHSLRLDTRYLPEGSETYTFTYNSGSNSWTTISGSGGSLSAVYPSVAYSFGPLSLDMVHLGTVTHGAQLQITTNKQEYTFPAYGTQWDWRVGLKRDSTNIKCRYDNGSGSLVDWITYIDNDVLDLNMELYADGESAPVDLSISYMTVSGTGLFDAVPVLSIEAVNSAGNVTVINGFTDSSGYIIKRLDILNEYKHYSELINDRVQIATDGLANGNIYIKYGEDLYKYSKTSFPLDLEGGESAVLIVSGTIPETTAKAFSYNSYSNGPLCYVEYDADRGGTYLKTMSTTTLSGSGYESLLDVGSSDYPWAWDVNNYTTLYYVSSTSLKQYDMDENDVAFCNVSSVEKIMGAGTSDQSAVTATVLNVYGEPLSGKTVTFTVSAGDGAVSPSTDCTTASGTASTTYTVGATVGTTTITATASDVSC